MIDENFDDPLLVVLNSCTVFWKADLGLTDQQLSNFRQSDTAADDFLFPIREWLEENVGRGRYDIYQKGVWFLRGNDAVHFKLRWHQG